MLSPQSSNASAPHPPPSTLSAAARTLAATRVAARLQLLCRLYELTGGHLLVGVDPVSLVESRPLAVSGGASRDDIAADLRTLDELGFILLGSNSVEMTSRGLREIERALLAPA